jgi:dethiobiotin synthase
MRRLGSDRSATRLRYWKPIQTGPAQDDDTAEVQRLAGLGEAEVCARGIRLADPVSPHLAAERAGIRIELGALVGLAGDGPDPMRWIVEGAGGALVPINRSDLMVDLMVRLALPVLVVGRTTLGTINHTLLTLEALRARALTIAGVLLVGEPNADNRRAIEAYGRVPCVGELPIVRPLTPAALRQAADALDPEGALDRFIA